MDPVDAAADVAGNLIPPEVKGVSELTKWRLWVSGVTFVTTAGLVTHILLACGYIPFYPGFAKAGEAAGVEMKVAAQMVALETRMAAKTDQLSETLKTQRLNTLRKDLFDARQKQCKAPSGAVRTMMAEQIAGMQTEYEQLAGKRYELLACADY
jgi:hypothetical protein